MKIYASHDNAGNIRALAIPAADVPGDLSFEPGPDEQVSAVEVDVVDGEKRREFLTDLMKNYRVERTASKAAASAAARLIKK